MIGIDLIFWWVGCAVCVATGLLATIIFIAWSTEHILRMTKTHALMIKLAQEHYTKKMRDKSAPG